MMHHRRHRFVHWSLIVWHAGYRSRGSQLVDHIKLSLN